MYKIWSEVKSRAYLPVTIELEFASYFRLVHDFIRLNYFFRREISERNVAFAQSTCSVRICRTHENLEYLEKPGTS